MVDDSPEDLAPSAEPGRAKREPPTIDLEASEVKAETASPVNPAEPESTGEPPSPSRPAKSWISVVLIAAMSGAGAGALVTGLIGGGTGWPEPAPPSAPPSASVNPAGIDDLATRLATLEARTGKPALATPDPATLGRIDALEKALTGLRGQFDGLRAQVEKLAGALSDVKTAPRETPAPAPDLGGIKDRIAGLERAISAQQAAMAQGIAQGSAKPADDAPLRRTVAAALLDLQVRFGDPYAAALSAAKALAPHPEALRPLDPFAAGGVPSPALLCRDLLAVVPKLSPPAPAAGPGSGIVERLQAGAAKLVRIERTDTKGTDRDSVVARVTAAALRNDVNEARRELNTMPPAERAAAQGWIDKADARDAALAVSGQFAAEAMAALAPQVK